MYLRIAATAALTLLTTACTTPNRVIQPVIYATDSDAGRAMRSAPVILVVEIVSTQLRGDPRAVAKPSDVGGPMVPTIPLYLARIKAKTLVTLRGPAAPDVEFYVFLRQEGKYLHTVGDYPSYDLELRARWVPALLEAWKSEREHISDPLNRLVALRLRAEFEGLSKSDVHDEGNANPPIPRDYYYLRDASDLIRLVGPFLVASELDAICSTSGNPLARMAACDVTAQEFPGRCSAFRNALDADSQQLETAFLSRALENCESWRHDQIESLRTKGLPPNVFYGWSDTAERRREAMRVYASAMDPDFHRAACDVAASIPEAQGIPECTGRGAR